MSREFVDSIISGSNIEAEAAFKSSISTKVGDALEVKRKDYSKYIFKRLDEESQSIKLAALEIVELLRFLYRVKISILKEVKDNIRSSILNDS